MVRGIKKAAPAEISSAGAAFVFAFCRKQPALPAALNSPDSKGVKYKT